MRKLSNIQVLRGLAALAVAVFHAGGELDGLGISGGVPNLVGGAFGVDVFFVISGFVMVHASVPLFGSWRSVLPFLLKRLARIAPLYWAVTLFFAIYAHHVLRDETGRGAFATFVATSLCFVSWLAPANADVDPVYPLGWTLEYEMFFYLCFAVVLALPRAAAVSTLASGFAVLVVLNLKDVVPDPWTHVAAPQILEFVAGMAVAQLALAGGRLPGAAAGALVVGGIVAVLVSVPSIDAWWAWRGIVWGGPAAAVVTAAALYRPAPAGGPPRADGPLRRWFERLGDASYALYLVHYGLYLAIDAMLGRLPGIARVPGSLIVLLLTGSAVAAALLVHRGFEAPVTHALQRWLSPRQAPALVATT